MFQRHPAYAQVFATSNGRGQTEPGDLRRFEVVAFAERRELRAIQGGQAASHAAPINADHLTGVEDAAEEGD